MQHSATYSPDDNKLRLYPAHRLDADEYARIKALGFKWAPRQELFVKPAWSPEAEDLLLEWCGEIGDEDKSLVDRAEDRADRFDGYSERRLADAESARKAVAAIADNIPLGQPIILGHHSEKHARRDQEKIENGMRKAVKMWRTSQYWTARAEGAIRHAKYKELPAVRHRRIKAIEADRRKVVKGKAEAEQQMKAWQAVAAIADPEKQRAAGLAVANLGGYWSMSFPLADYPRDPPASQYEGPMGLWSAIDGNVITAAQAAAIAIQGYERSIPRKDRWLEHYDNRLSYEKAMLAEQIGGGDAGAATTMGDRFAFAVGGEVFIRDQWLTVIRVNRSGGVVNSITHAAPRSVTWQKFWKTGVESITDYRPPSAEQAAAVKAATKIAPICNYPGEGFAHMTQAEFDKVPESYRCYRPRAATETAGRHRTRCAIGAYAFKGQCDDNKRHSYAPVFITDAKRVDPPKIVPPSEPKDPAEFVADFVAPAETVETPTEAGRLGSDDCCSECREMIGADGTCACDSEPTEADGAYVPEAPEFSPEGVWGGGAPDDDVPAAEATAPAGFDGSERWGNSGLVGHGVNSPAMMEARAQFEAARDPLPATADLPAPSPAADFEAMARTLKAGGVQVVVAPQLFPTPPRLAREMVELADIRHGETVLEPSAGTGNIIDAVRAAATAGECGRCVVTAVELNVRLAERLRTVVCLGDTFVHCGDFLEFDPPAERFDKVLMNPPFERGDDIRHIEHARKFLKPGGRLVAICADGPRQRERLQPIAREYRPLPAGTFKSAGTMVNTALVVIDAPAPPG